MNNELYGEWIPQYEGLYSVTRDGKVYSHKSSEPKRIGSTPTKKGAVKLSLCKNGSVLPTTIHVVVAMTYRGHTPCGMERVVDHIDNRMTETFKGKPIKSNHVDNLQIVTNRFNSTKDKTGKTSKFVGVYWRKDRHIFHAQIRWGEGGLILSHLGYFNNEEEAGKTYQNALSFLEENGTLVGFVTPNGRVIKRSKSST